MLIKEHKNCRLCNCSEFTPLISLGSQPLTGVFLKPNEDDPLKAPLELIVCNNCKFMQLRHSVDTDLMYSSYWYRSGTNQTMRDHLAGIAQDIEKRIDLIDGDIIIDTGCNDGTLLKSYKDKSIVKIGVDPSNAILSIEEKENFIKINDYFTYNSVKKYVAANKVKVITSISMFYDLDRPSEFVQDIKSILHDEGIWVVEMNYTGDMIDNLGYDMISHEHVAYYTYITFEKLINENGMYINDVSTNKINGGSVRFIVGKKQSESGAAKTFKATELSRGYDQLDYYKNFSTRIDKFKDSLVNFIYQIKKDNKKVFAYGASTRGNTVMQHCGFTRNDINFALDRNPIKYGLEMSGSRIPIISETDGRSLCPDYLLILPYYFLDEFIDREKSFLESGGKFIVYLPELKVISMKDGNLLEDKY